MRARANTQDGQLVGVPDMCPLLCNVLHYTVTLRQNHGDLQYTYLNCAGLQLMIDDRGMPTLWVYDSCDELDKGDVTPCSSVMKGTGSIFIFLTQDLWALLHQVLQESQVTLLSQLDGNIESDIIQGE